MTTLKRTIGSADLFAFAVGTIIGVGWLVVVGSWLLDAGPGGALIGLGIGAIAVAAIGGAYAEVFSSLPATGGEVVVGLSAFGRGAGFVAGWILIYIYFSVSAFEAISVGWLVTVIAGDPLDFGSYVLFGNEVQIAALVVGLIGTLVVCAANYAGASVAAGLQKTLLAVLLALTGIFFAFAIRYGTYENLTPWVEGVSPKLKLIGIIGILATAPFWFAGFNVLPQALGERRHGFRLASLGKIIVASVLLAFVFYALVILATGAVLPRSDISGMDLPAATAFEVAFQSRAMANIVLIVGLLGLVSTWNAVVFAGARVLYSLSTLGLLPRFLSAAHERYGTPHKAIVTISLLSVLITPLGREALITIVSAVGFGFSMMYLLVAVSVPVLRRRDLQGELSTSDRYKMPGGQAAVMSVIAVAALLVALSATQLLSTVIGGEYWQGAIAFAWATSGLIIWVIFRHRTSSRISTDPGPGAQVPQ